MRFALALIAVGLTACAADSPSAPTGPVDERVVLAPGETANIAGADILIRFQGVPGDSRCPGDAICVWAGDATVRVEILASGREASVHELHTFDKKTVQQRDVTIALENLSPYPFYSRPIAPADYRVTLHVTR